MTFRELAIGQGFKFDPGVSTFSAICKKVSARCYTWHDNDGRELRSTVGSAKVGVVPLAVELRTV